MLSKYTEEFISKSEQIHGTKYLYSKVEFKQNKRTVTVICPKHGDFEITARAHLLGVGCEDCRNNKARKYTKATFAKIDNERYIKLSEEKHGKGTYDYTPTNYVSANKKVTIRCKKHGDFEVTARSHYARGVGCPECKPGRKVPANKITLEDFIAKSNAKHGEGTYDYSKVVLGGSKDNVIIICKKHGEFRQRPHTHYHYGKGCTLCAAEKRAIPAKVKGEQFIAKAKLKHGEDTYDYSKVNYVGHKLNVTIICKKHGEFFQTPAHHLGGRGCDACKGLSEKN